jgi:hypothetical protein
MLLLGAGVLTALLVVHRPVKSFNQVTETVPKLDRIIWSDVNSGILRWRQAEVTL